MANNNENVPSCASQNAKIRAWLLEGKEITSWDAIMNFGCTRLASRIYDLREQGMDIKVKRRPTAKGGTVAVYYLEEEDKE